MLQTMSNGAGYFFYFFICFGLDDAAELLRKQVLASVQTS